jgi:hypothetical protein
VTPVFERLLNEAAARLCGRTTHRDTYVKPPNYCTDRNALPELWEVFAKSGTRLLFECELHEFHKEDISSEVWQMITAPVYKHVIAALKACDVWTSEMEEEWRKQCSSL